MQKATKNCFFEKKYIIQIYGKGVGFHILNFTFIFMCDNKTMYNHKNVKNFIINFLIRHTATC